MRQISANQDYQTSASPSRSMTQVREKKKQKVRKKRLRNRPVFGTQNRSQKWDQLFSAYFKVNRGQKSVPFLRRIFGPQK